MKRPAFFVGAFVIGAIVLIVAGILWLSGSGLFSKQQRAVIYFQGGVAGLYVGAPVSFRGVPVGQVEDIGIEVDQRTLAARIPVRMRLNTNSVRFRNPGAVEDLPPDLPVLVERGLRAKLVQQSFVTGQKAIELDFLENAPQVQVSQGSTPEIPVVADRFDALFDQVAELPLRETVSDLRDTLTALKDTLQTTQETLNTAGNEVSITAIEARRTLGAASQSLAAVGGTLQRIERSATRTLDSVAQLADTSRNTVGALEPELARTLAGAREATESARIAMARVAELTAPGAPLHDDLDAAMRDFSQAARGLREWAELLEEQPNAAIFGRNRR